MDRLRIIALALCIASCSTVRTADRAENNLTQRYGSVRVYSGSNYKIVAASGMTYYYYKGRQTDHVTLVTTLGFDPELNK